jgi:uncharacterized protein YndB with AHSA1/START domain
MATVDIDTTIEIEAPPERVWDIMVDPARSWRWLGAFGFQPRVGQRFVMQPSRRRREAGDLTDAVPCRLEVVAPPRRMRFSWSYPGRPSTDVAIALTPIVGGTHVRLTHVGFEALEADLEPSDVEIAVAALADSWANETLPALKALAEEG